MKRTATILLAAAAIVFAAACQKTPEAVKLEISNYTLAESASFGESVDFTVTVPSASNVTAALIKDGKQLSSVTVREASDDVYSGTLSIPYAKNIADGDYDVMFMAMGSGSDRAEKTVKIALAHPEFASVAFVSGSERIELTASETVWSYTGALPAELSGVFEAKTAAGKVCTFGGSNVDNIEFGNASSVALYSYAEAIPEGTLSFDVVSFNVKYPLEALYVIVPETADPAYPGTIDVEFKKGQIVAFAGLGDLWVDIDFFENNGDGTYTKGDFVGTLTLS